MNLNTFYPIILVLLALYSLSHFMKKNIMGLLPSFLVGLSLWMYFFAIVGYLELGYQLSISLILLVALYTLVKSKFRNPNFFNIQIFFVLIVYGFLLVWNQGRYFYQWDEFSHWGLMIKEMFRLDQLYSIDASHLITHKDYPPIIQILQYFWLKTYGAYHEPQIYIVLQFLGLSFLLSISTVLKNKLNSLFIFILVLAAFVLFQGIFDLEDAKFFMTIYLDFILALSFAYLLFLVFKDDQSFLDSLQITMMASFLVLVKEMGLFFAFIAGLIWLLKKSLESKTLKSIVIEGLFWLIPIGFFISWKLYFSQFNYVGQFQTSEIDLLKFYEIVFLNKGLMWQLEAYQNFMSSLNTLDIIKHPITLNHYEMNALFLGLSYLLSKVVPKEQEKKSRLLLVGMTLMSNAYALVMLLLYIFNFGPYEGPRLASVMRYMSSYWYALSATFLMIFIDGLIQRKWPLFRLSLSVLILSLLLSSNGLERIKADLTVDNFESYFVVDTQRLRNETEVDSKIYFIAQDHIGNYLNYVRYLVNDRLFNNDGFNIGTPKDSEDIWVSDYDADEFIDAVKEYDYLYIYHINDEFYERFYKIMPHNFYMEDHQLLRIIKTENTIEFEVMYPN